ncbi:hypothetical protein EBOKLHFM_00219 [Klebsiella phage KP13-26]|nr:hypothetical protein EBOKLHFM_00219 [Klebsiella phage KP13-26]
MSENLITRFGITIDLSREGHTGCPRCMSNGNDRSRNNLMVYGLDQNLEHRGAKCFACHYTIPSVEWLRENGEELEEEEEIVGSEFNPEIRKLIVESTGTDSRNYRGIKTEYSKFYAVRYEYDNERNVVSVLYPTTIDGSLVGFKKRIHPKDFSKPIGQVGKDVELFGQVKFKERNHTILITGGEHDVLAAYQMLSENMDKKYEVPAVVCGTTGETSAYKQIQAQYHFLSQFKKIIICMDNDKAGEEAFQNILKVLPRNKVYLMKMELKDANKYLEEGREKDFVKAFWGAKLYTPAGVYASNVLYEAALECLEAKVITLPSFMRVAANMLGGGLVEEEITVILAKTSIGKTLLVNEITKHIITAHPEHTLGILSLEATYKKYSRNLLSAYLHVPLHRKTAEEKQHILEENKDKIVRFYERPDGSPRFYVCDDRGANVESIQEKVLEMIIHYGVTILVIDPYSDLLSGMSVQEQEELATWLKRIMKEYGITIIVISHVKKSSNNSDEHITEDDAMGSSFLAKGAGITIALERDKQAEDPMERNRTYCYILKNREFSETGKAGSFFYEIKTATLYDYEQYTSNPNNIPEGSY